MNKELWKVVMMSAYGVKRDLNCAIPSETEAEDFAEELGWHYVDENEFDWALVVEPDDFDYDAWADDYELGDDDSEGIE